MPISLFFSVAAEGGLQDGAVTARDSLNCKVILKESIMPASIILPKNLAPQLMATFSELGSILQSEKRSRMSITALACFHETC